MGSGKPATGLGSEDAEITLGVLDAVHENESVTQRSMASELGIALGLANAYLKRCVRKGLIKVSQAPPNRYAYYLTPQGFAEKSRLTAEYLSSSFTFFRRARAQCEEAVKVCVDNGWSRVALVGRSELAEIAALCNSEAGLEMVLVDESEEPAERFFGMAVARSLDEATDLDAAIVTDLAGGQQAYDRLARRLDAARIFTPSMLKIRRGAEPASSAAAAE